ncbi:MAG: arabinogalactan endo-beta-1,4-galactanase [Spirosomataceae bacterium]
MLKGSVVQRIVLIVFGAMMLGACREASVAQQPKLYLGGDLSYTNEMDDCGGVYRKNGKQVDAYKLFAEEGAKIIRLRLWHNPNWTQYSTFADVKRSIKRAKENQMDILLDFHYSDDWADPKHQVIPKAWEKIKDTKILGDSVYNYTYNTLINLNQLNLLPEIVQVGNEINSEVMQYTKESAATINWERNVALLNRGIEAVNDAAKKIGKPIQTMLHIAQPDEAFGWFENARKYGIKQYDWIGLSYYPKWSKFNLERLAVEIDRLKSTFSRRVMIVETGLPYSPNNFDKASNVLGADSKLDGYDLSREGQAKFMQDLVKSVIRGGGEGVIYWEPAWISTSCSTQWGQGSHWENATFFDAENNNEVLPAIKFLYSKSYSTK